VEPKFDCEVLLPEEEVALPERRPELDFDISVAGLDLPQDEQEGLTSEIRHLVQSEVEGRPASKQARPAKKADPQKDEEPFVDVALGGLPITSTARARLTSAIQQLVVTRTYAAVASPVPLLVCVKTSNMPQLPGFRIDTEQLINGILLKGTDLDGPLVMALYSDWDTLRVSLTARAADPYPGNQFNPGTLELMTAELIMDPSLTIMYPQYGTHLSDWAKQLSSFNWCVGKLASVETRRYNQVVSMKCSSRTWAGASVPDPSGPYDHSTKTVYWPVWPTESLVLTKAGFLGYTWFVAHFSPKGFWRLFGGRTVRFTWLTD
jgi:hypothetical protein